MIYTNFITIIYSLKNKSLRNSMYIPILQFLWKTVLAWLKFSGPWSKIYWELKYNRFSCVFYNLPISFPFLYALSEVHLDVGELWLAFIRLLWAGTMNVHNLLYTQVAFSAL